jgi:hypothetical protein
LLAMEMDFKSKRKFFFQKMKKKSAKKWCPVFDLDVSDETRRQTDRWMFILNCIISLDTNTKKWTEKLLTNIPSWTSTLAQRLEQSTTKSEGSGFELLTRRTISR